MGKLEKLLGQHLSTEEEEKILQEAIEFKLDKDLKARMETQLLEKKGLSRSPTREKQTSRIILIRRLIAVAASILVLFLIFQTLQSNTIDAQQQAMIYLKEYDTFHGGNSKGASTDDDNRRLGIQAFNQKNFLEATQYFSKIQLKQEEDLLYAARAFLFIEQYGAAVEALEKLSTKSTRFRQETNWFLSLAYILEKQEEKGKAVLKKINPEDWNYDKAQELLHKL